MSQSFSETEESDLQQLADNLIGAVLKFRATFRKIIENQPHKGHSKDLRSPNSSPTGYTPDFEWKAQPYVPSSVVIGECTLSDRLSFAKGVVGRL